MHIASIVKKITRTQQSTCPSVPRPASIRLPEKLLVVSQLEHLGDLGDFAQRVVKLLARVSGGDAEPSAGLEQWDCGEPDHHHGQLQRYV